MTRQQFLAWLMRPSLTGVALACILGTAIGAEAQALKDVKIPDTPLVLKAQGSFFVGGVTKVSEHAALPFAPPGQPAPAPTPQQILDKQRWRDERLAALVAHKKSQPKSQ